MKVSVVIATYNGEKYILEQLNSIKNQTVQPDEVLIADDCSTDDTYHIISDYIFSNKLSKWKLIKNDTNMGWRKNFMQLFSIAKNDIIFCCDQDDIWFENKIEEMLNAINTNSNIKVLASDYKLKYENGGKIHKEKFINEEKGELIKKTFNGKSFGVYKPGCTMCFKKEILPTLKKIWYDGLAHDALLWLYGMLTDSMYIINKPLIIFRRHENNNTPSNNKDKKTRSSIMLNGYKKAESILNNKNELCLSNEYIKKITKLQFLYKKRYDAIKSGNVIKSILLIRYIFRYDNVKSWVGDVVSTLR